MLPSDSVSILKQQFIEIDGELEQVNADWRCAYVNSSSGREALQANLADPYYTSIMKVWRDTPTVEDPIIDDVLNKGNI